MARSRKSRQPTPPPPPQPPTNRPFAEVLKAAAPAPKPKAPPPPKPTPPLDDLALFKAAVAGVKPLPDRKRERVGPPPGPPSTEPPYDEDAETLSRLAAMIDGEEPLDGFSEEHSEWIADDVDPGILPRLVAGEFAWQEHLDLHGMTREQAHAACVRFLASARLKHARCVLIVHGRGNHSEGQVPVIKLALQRWLRRAPLSAWVFAWATARPVDGGAGAINVLLRD